MIVNKPRLTMYQLRFLFETFKVGGYLTDINLYSPQAHKAITFLATKGFLNIHQFETEENPVVPGYRKKMLLILTEQGVEEAKKQFFNFLQTAKVHLKHCLLIPGDKIRVIIDLSNKDKPEDQGKYVRAPKTEIEKGNYSIVSIDKRTLLVISDVGEKYRLNSYHMREHMLLDFSKFGTRDDEIGRRFGPLNVKKLSRNLHSFIKDNFKVVKLINQIQKSSVGKGRPGGS